MWFVCGRGLEDWGIRGYLASPAVPKRTTSSAHTGSDPCGFTRIKIQMIKMRNWSFRSSDADWIDGLRMIDYDWSWYLNLMDSLHIYMKFHINFRNSDYIWIYIYRCACARIDGHWWIHDLKSWGFDNPRGDHGDQKEKSPRRPIAPVLVSWNGGPLHQSITVMAPNPVISQL